LGVKFWGRVQGVGFRWNVKDVSSGYSVTGYVKNLSDGSVEMLAEGEKEEVLSFLVAVEERMLGYVTDRVQFPRSGVRQFSSFEITY
jgi:acylphosphatase